MSNIRMSSKPTRIVKEPCVVGTGQGRRAQILCDNGKTYTYLELAREIGISDTNLRRLISLYGWDSPKVFAGPRFRSTLNELSDEPRLHLLAKIPNPTKFDRMFA